MKKWIIFFVIIYLFTYFDIKFILKNKESQPFLYSRIENKFILKNYFEYFYSDEKKIKNIESITLSKENLFSQNTILFEKKNIEIFKSYNFKFILNPFFTKRILVNSSILIGDKIIKNKQVYEPYYEFGIYPFWAFIPVFEYAKPIVIFKIGENQ